MAEHEELAVVDERRQSLLAAKENLRLAQLEAAKNANVYAKAGADKMKAAAQDVQLVSSKKWYAWWQQPSKVPKNLVANGVEAPWAETASSALEQVKKLAQAGEDTFEASGSKQGATIETAKEINEKGVSLIRVKKDIAVDPNAILLSQVNAQANGMANNGLIYKREHYAYRGGKTFLFHEIKNYGLGGVVAPRDAAMLVTWDQDEEGVITIASKSVEKSIKEKSVPGAVRQSVLLFGMVIKPKKVAASGLFASGEVDGAEVTVVSHTLLKGFVPTFVSKQLALGELFSYLGSLEGFAQSLSKDEEKLKDWTERYVLYPDGSPEDDDEEEPEAEE